MMQFHPFLRRFLLAMVMTFGLVALSLTVFLYRANELHVFDDSAVITDANILWGPGFGQQFQAYKIQRALYEKPALLVLGSSRSTQFRSEMAGQIPFYNAALGANTFHEATAFMTALLSSHKPSVVLLGIDPWWFDPAKGSRETSKSIEAFSYKNMLANIINGGARWAVIKSLLSDTLHTGLDPLGNRQPVGYLAALTANGFRPDGSYQYGDLLRGLNEYYNLAGIGKRFGFTHYANYVRTIDNRFSYVGEPDPQMVTALQNFIKLNRDHGVEPILFFPPFTTTINKAIFETPEQRRYFSAVEIIVRKIAAETKVSFFNFTDPASLGLDDNHALDGLHFDEIAALEMMRKMMSGNKKLSGLFGDDSRRSFHDLWMHRLNGPDSHRIIP